MGIVNSIFSQIGREIGRDIYNGAKNNLKNRGRDNKWINLSSEISNFRPSSYDKVSMRKIEELVMMCENVDFSQVSYEDFFELDEKIDLLKEIVLDNYVQDLEELDKRNFDNLKLYHELNKKNVKKQLENQIEKVSMLKDVKTLSETILYILNRKWIFFHMFIVALFFVFSGFSFKGALTVIDGVNQNPYGGLAFTYLVVIIPTSIFFSFIWRAGLNSENDSERNKLKMLEQLNYKIESIQFPK